MLAFCQKPANSFLNSCLDDFSLLESLIQNLTIMKNKFAFTHHYVVKLLSLLFLFFLFAGLECDDEKDYSICTRQSTHEANWPGETFGFTHESNTESYTNYFRLSTGDHYNICPTEPVTLVGKVVAKDNTIIPPPNYIRLYWETDLGWLKWKNYMPLSRQSEHDNIWEVEVPLGNLSVNFDEDRAANLRVWLLMQFQSIDNTYESDIAWLNNEFSSMTAKANITLYEDRDP